MAEFNITTSPWDESLFDCGLTAEGKRQYDEISKRYQGRPPFEDIDDQLVIQDTEDEYDVEIVNSGKTRVVTIPDNDLIRGNTECIVKVQWDPHYQQTANEIFVWENANGRQAALLAPLLDWSEMRLWNVMPKAEFYTHIPIAELSTMANNLDKALFDEGIKSRDVRAGNVGRIQGREVLIDYGDVEFR